jgi:phosphonate degradation associated HDIG domain protein
VYAIRPGIDDETQSVMSVADEIVALLDARGAAAYVGEPVSVLEHGLQAAHFARAAGAADELVLATLLHDIGHVLGDAPDDIAAWHTDARHEQTGSAWLARRFGPAVSEPVRLHVAAKRYLCATTPEYLEKLTSASRRTLELQGGPMSADEVVAFRREAHCREAVRVRLWDDAGKIEGLVTAALREYLELIESLALRHAPCRS